MKNATIELQLTEGDKLTLELLSLVAGRVARVLYPNDRLGSERAEALITSMVEQALRGSKGALSSSREVKERLHAELGRAALTQLGDQERQHLFAAVYPAVAGDNYAHKVLSELCNKPDVWNDPQ
ncbi:hypothetical protein FXN65_13775 [Metapseudomonas lalkuanensis]|uniref:Uncharacterized protein n=1 Tax=Metapseudomonas lalkuanensis TaxID=2604832 RepID=A0A5J6QP35_9GAMM|nr:hypothetical protein [Pseudomonas lalkuanensis]QEY63081.1 hypothetical protein FXN65_13775 [Pseudomonas lalkuanensis]